MPRYCVNHIMVNELIQFGYTFSLVSVFVAILTITLLAFVGFWRPDFLDSRIFLWILGLAVGVPLAAFVLTLFCSLFEILLEFLLDRLIWIISLTQHDTNDHTDTLDNSRREWTSQPPRFGWQSSVDAPQLPGSFTTNKLCDNCLLVVKESGLISGSPEINTRRIEWHDHYSSLQELQVSSDKSCHLCSIFVYSLQHRYQTPQNTKLKIKVWEQPWGEKRYMQLYHGGNELSKEIQIIEGGLSSSDSIFTTLTNI